MTLATARERQWGRSGMDGGSPLQVEPSLAVRAIRLQQREFRCRGSLEGRVCRRGRVLRAPVNSSQKWASQPLLKTFVYVCKTHT